MQVKLLEVETAAAAGEGGSTMELFLPTVALTFDTASFSAAVAAATADDDVDAVVVADAAEGSAELVVDSVGSDGRRVSSNAPLLAGRAGLSWCTPFGGLVDAWVVSFVDRDLTKVTRR
jgi:hypothetical protein